MPYTEFADFGSAMVSPHHRLRAHGRCATGARNHPWFFPSSSRRSIPLYWKLHWCVRARVDTVYILLLVEERLLVLGWEVGAGEAEILVVPEPSAQTTVESVRPIPTRPTAIAKPRSG